MAEQNPNSKADPSALTTDVLRREIANLGEICETRFRQIEVDRQVRVAERDEDLTRAKDTAQRLEREVESTALRLEKQVETTAIRLEKAVQVALEAVSATAVIHADAHDKEHNSHERIHEVEKLQLDKASEALDKRLESMNEFRSTLKDQSNSFLPRETYDTTLGTWTKWREEVNLVITKLEGSIIGRTIFDTTTDNLHEKINVMEKRMAYYAGFAAAVGAGISIIIRLSEAL